jgi:hypothetical protein
VNDDVPYLHEMTIMFSPNPKSKLKRRLISEPMMERGHVSLYSAALGLVAGQSVFKMVALEKQ